MNCKLVLILGLFGVAHSSCSGDDQVDPMASALAPLDIPERGVLGAEKPLDLVVVSIDTLRADRLPFYGAERATGGDPAQKWSLSWIGANSTLFEQVWAPAGVTQPSFGSFWTGLSTLEHGAARNRQIVLAPTYAMQLAASGWQAHASVSNFILRPGQGLDRGFDSYQVNPKALEPTGPAKLLAKTSADVAAKKRSLIWAHYMAPHQPYEPHANYRGRWSSATGIAANNDTLYAIHREPKTADAATLEHLRSLYDEEILTANDYVMEFLTGLDAQYQKAGRGGLLDNAVVVFMSDHGEGLADHGSYFMHAKSLYSGVIQVPLMVLGGDWQQGQRIARAVSLQEVMPMVLNGAQPQTRVHCSSWADSFYAARDERFTLIHNPTGDVQGPLEPPKDVAFTYPQVALFDRDADPLEQHDVAAQYPDETRRMLNALHDWYYALDIEENRDLAPLTVEEQALYEELGYTASNELPPLNLDRPWLGAQWKP